MAKDVELETTASFCDKPYCLGLGREWLECCDSYAKANEHAQGASTNRFSFKTESEMKVLSKGFVPKNTSNSTSWAVRNFRAWSNSRNECFPDDPVPNDLLTSSDTETLNKWLSLFAAETRNSKGEPYPPSTIYQLLSGLLRSMREHNPECPNFVDKKNPSFRKLHRTLDSHFHSLKERGVGVSVKSAEIISKDEENRLWSSGVMGIHSPTALFNAIFYCNGKNLCLRGGDEHWRLQLSQFERKTDHYIYTENCSKNRSGTFKQLHVKNKVVPFYCTCPTSEMKLEVSHCHVHLLDLYLSKLPTSEGPFYWRPLQATPKGSDSPWFCQMRVGKNTLQSKLKTMCSEAGVEGHKTNHSLRATGATEMYVANVPEKIIQERTGHRSLTALRVYERTTEDQHRAASTVLTSSHRTNFQQVHSQIQQTNCNLAMQYQPSAETTSSTATGINLSFSNLKDCVVNVYHHD